MQSDITPPDDSSPDKKSKLKLPYFPGHSKDNSMPKPETTVDLGVGKLKWHHKIKHHLSKRSKVELAILGGLVLGGLTLFGMLIWHYTHKPAVHVVYKQKPYVAPKPTTVASPLSGLQVAPDVAKRPVTGIMIENSPDARPQSGLQDAGVVYEAIAEGGITRFLALFQDTRPSYIGPVRSLRPYYIDFGAPYQAGFAHVGGSPDALSQIRSGGSNRDLDQFFNADTYSRVNSRAAPHNVYTDFDRLDKLNQAKGFTSSKFDPWKRKDDKKVATPTAAHIDVKISSALYFSHYDYDAASNSYARSEGGAPHMQVTSADDKSGTQIKPKVVVALVMSYSVIDGAGHSGYGVSGSGQMYVFQDGAVTQGTWSKADRTSMFQFKDSAGNILPLNAGQTWVVAVSNPTEVTYQ